MCMHVCVYVCVCVCVYVCVCVCGYVYVCVCVVRGGKGVKLLKGGERGL